MAEQESGPGLSIGQSLTLMFGFLIASVLIFVFGFWVGYDAAQRRLAREQQVIRLPVQGRPTVRGETTPTPTATKVAAETPTPTKKVVTKSPLTGRKTTPTKAATRTKTKAPPATATPSVPAPTRTRTMTPKPTATLKVESEAGGVIWTVQAGATTDPVQAVMLGRRLREKGYDAYTVTGKVDGVMWYRVRVGQFRSRVQAKVLEIRLQEEEGLEEAFAVRR